MLFAEEQCVELVYEFGPGEAQAAAKVLARRLELLGIKGSEAKALEDGKRVAIRLGTPDRAGEVRAMATRVGRLEFRRMVNPDMPGYRFHRKEFDAALARGVEPARACDVPRGSLIWEERDLWPGGLRWYRNPNPSEKLKEDWVLCEVDAQGITEEALEKVQVVRSGASIDVKLRAVHFEVKEGFQDAMERLTQVGENEETRLAVIVDGEVIFAPILRSTLSRNGEVSFADGSAARAFAAAIGGGTLPSKSEFVEERAIGR